MQVLMEGGFYFSEEWGKGQLNGDDNDKTSIVTKEFYTVFEFLKFNDNIHIIAFM